MKKIAMTAFTSAAVLVLAACGSADDASEDAMADNVEMPADDAMAGAADPVADDNLESEPAVSDDTASEAADAAEAAVADVNAATEAATRAAEEGM